MFYISVHEKRFDLIIITLDRYTEKWLQNVIHKFQTVEHYNKIIYDKLHINDSFGFMNGSDDLWF